MDNEIKYMHNAVEDELKKSGAFDDLKIRACSILEADGTIARLTEATRSAARKILMEQPEVTDHREQYHKIRQHVMSSSENSELTEALTKLLQDPHGNFNKEIRSKVMRAMDRVRPGQGMDREWNSMGPLDRPMGGGGGMERGPGWERMGSQGGGAGLGGMDRGMDRGMERGMGRDRSGGMMDRPGGLDRGMMDRPHSGGMDRGMDRPSGSAGGRLMVQGAGDDGDVSMDLAWVNE